LVFHPVARNFLTNEEIFVQSGATLYLLLVKVTRFSALDGVGDKGHATTILPPGKRPFSHCAEGYVGSRPLWTGVENLAPIGI
jgi:hypothetical protein